MGISGSGGVVWQPMTIANRTGITRRFDLPSQRPAHAGAGRIRTGGRRTTRCCGARRLRAAPCVRSPPPERPITLPEPRVPCKRRATNAPSAPIKAVVDGKQFRWARKARAGAPGAREKPGLEHVGPGAGSPSHSSMTYPMTTTAPLSRLELGAGADEPGAGARMPVSSSRLAQGRPPPWSRQARQSPRQRPFADARFNGPTRQEQRVAVRDQAARGRHRVVVEEAAAGGAVGAAVRRRRPRSARRTGGAEIPFDGPDVRAHGATVATPRGFVYARGRAQRNRGGRVRDRPGDQPEKASAVELADLREDVVGARPWNGTCSAIRRARRRRAEMGYFRVRPRSSSQVP